MSFFHLTLMGHENQFQAMKHMEPINKNGNSTRLREVPTGREPRSPVEKQLARELTGNIQSREWSSPAISNINYHTLRTMHVRGDQDHNHITRQPLTTAQNIGWWTKDSPLKVNEPWTHEKRHVHAQSEMTKFVDDMILTDRYFRLY